MEPTSQPDTQNESRLAAMLFFFVLALLVLGLIIFALWGLPAVTMIALVATVAVFALLVAYAAGF